MRRVEPSRVGVGHPPCAAGFTLLEVLAAFVILALSYVVLGDLVAGALRNTRIAAEYDAALSHARTKLDELGADLPLSPGREVGEIAGTPFHWEIGIEPAPASLLGAQVGQASEPAWDPLAEPQLVRVRVTVSWQDRSVEIDTLRLCARKGTTSDVHGG